MAYGIDINDEKYGRWVDNRPRTPPDKIPHYKWTDEHLADWEEFWNSKDFDAFTKEEIEEKISAMKSDVRFPSE